MKNSLNRLTLMGRQSWATLSRPCGTEFGILGSHAHSNALNYPSPSSSEVFRSLFSYRISPDQR
jgi:hypothetical protein